MEMIAFSYFQMALFVILGVWELIWKGIAMWDCARKNKSTWFIFILILNTVGILPIVYLLFFKDEKKRSMKKKALKRR